MLDQAYLEMPEGRAFSHITLRATDSGHSVEEVLGTFDAAGLRRGAIHQIVTETSLDAAREAFVAHVATRQSEGFQRTR